MEVGVQEFGKKLGVPLVNEKNWQNILDPLNKAIKSLPHKGPGTVEMSEASANLYAVKLAWRNEVMHPNDKYTLEEAKNLIGQVKLFMGQLATII
jgi:biotin carboxylase